MILIYTHKITKRVQYIFKLYFGSLLGLEYKFTSNLDEFAEFDGLKISYTKKKIDDELHFCSTDLLFETGVEGQEPGFFKYEENVAFFPVYEKKSVIPFDPFAAGFFLLTRYEEYLPYIKDKFDRFDASQSVSQKHGFLHKPMVNIWAEKLKEILSARAPQLKFKERNFEFISTIDIDSAYAYKYKGTVRTIGGLMKSLVKFDFTEMWERVLVLGGMAKDPFDTYALQLRLQKKYNLFPIYFILFADYGKFDKNIPVYNPKFQRRVKSLADYAEVGIHPSYDSNYSFEKLKVETKRLSKVLNREISKSRQHFLKLTFPNTYRNLINLDITDDYTMGYASEPGFRAGICDPFFFYDLDMETETKLKIHPFQVMEGTLKDYMHLSTDQSLIRIKKLIDEVRTVNGTFISIWHNESLSNNKQWAGWDKVYEEMIEYAVS
jgi:hypothetical protein